MGQNMQELAWCTNVNGQEYKGFQFSTFKKVAVASNW